MMASKDLGEGIGRGCFNSFKCDLKRKATPPPRDPMRGSFRSLKDGGVMSARNEGVSNELSQVSFSDSRSTEFSQSRL